MRKITEKRKLKEKRGTGTGASYKPWIQAKEIGSIGTESVFNDWKHGRQIQCLSQGEKYAYHILRWQEDVLDIREQFPLELEHTLDIARKLGLPHPHNRNTHMTTDFLVDFQTLDGSQYQKAFSIKPNNSSFNKYNLKNFEIEYVYWGKLGIHLEIIPADNINRAYVSNIIQCVRYYDPKTIQNYTDLVKHLIARKILTVDMESCYLNFTEIAEKIFTSPAQIKKIIEVCKEKRYKHGQIEIL